MLRSPVLFVVTLALTGCANDFQLVERPDLTVGPGDSAASNSIDDTVDAPRHNNRQDDVPPPPADDCDHTSDEIYVIDRSTDALYLFDPPTGDFSALGYLDCTPWGSPGSMAISRDGYAYVRYSDNTVYEVDLTDGSCQQTQYDNGNFGAFGMGYATAQAGTWQDDLYLANHNRLARVDTSTWQVTPLGNLPSQSELTGNAAGELWAFLPLEQPAELVRIDKGNGAVRETLTMPSFPPPMNIDAFAFATWGGDFYVFVREYGMGSSTDVYRVTRGGQATLVHTNTGFDIVGAGVSTCAPAE